MKPKRDGEQMGNWRSFKKRQSSRKDGMKPGPSGLDPPEASLVP